MHAPKMPPFTSELPHIAGDVLARIRERRPRVHCITNSVAQNFTANVLLAAGAIPSMTVAPDEIGEFVARADALLVNLGTFNQERRDATEIAIATAVERCRPWVLDPVFVDRSQPRTVFAQRLVAERPSVVRLNEAEFSALAGAPANDEALRRYAQEQACIIALTGATDHVTDGTRLVGVNNGDPLMSRVTAMGCAGTALVAAALAVDGDALAAAAAALMAFAVAGEVAAGRAHGPGSFAAEIIDALYGLDRETLRTRGRAT